MLKTLATGLELKSGVCDYEKKSKTKKGYLNKYIKIIPRSLRGVSISHPSP